MLRVDIREYDSKPFKNQRIIDSLHAMEKPVLQLLEQSAKDERFRELRRDLSELIEITKKRYHLLHATFGTNILLAEPKDLPIDKKMWVQNKISQYNYELRILYQFAFSTIASQPGNDDYESLRRRLLTVCRQHSMQSKALYDACDFGASSQPLLSASSRDSKQSSFQWEPNTRWNSNFSSLPDYWAWNGFGDGLAGRDPSIFKWALTDQYGTAFLSGRAVGGLVHHGGGIMRATFGIVDRSFSQLKDLGVSAVNGTVKAAECCGNATCQCANCVNSCLLNCFKAMLCCNFRGGGEGICKLIGGLFSIGGTATVGLVGGGTDPVKPVNGGGKPHPTSFAQSGMASSSTGAAAAMESTPFSLYTGLKYTWFGTLAAVFVPNHFFTARKNVKNWCAGYKVTESKALLAAQAGALFLGGAAGYFMTYGGPHMAYVCSLLFGWAAPKLTKYYWNRSNASLFGTKNPDKYRLTQEAAEKLEEKAKDASPLQLQFLIDHVEEEIEKEKRHAKRTQGCGRKFLYRLWGVPFVETPKLGQLELVMRHLRAGEFAEAVREGRGEINIPALLKGQVQLDEARITPVDSL